MIRTAIVTPQRASMPRFVQKPASDLFREHSTPDPQPYRPFSSMNANKGQLVELLIGLDLNQATSYELGNLSSYIDHLSNLVEDFGRLDMGYLNANDDPVQIGIEDIQPGSLHTVRPGKGERVVNIRFRRFDIVLHDTTVPLFGLVLGRLIVNPILGNLYHPIMTHWVVMFSNDGDLWALRADEIDDNEKEYGSDDDDNGPTYDMAPALFGYVDSRVVKLGPLSSVHARNPLRPEVAAGVDTWTSTWVTVVKDTVLPTFDKDGRFSRYYGGSWVHPMANTKELLTMRGLPVMAV